MKKNPSSRLFFSSFFLYLMAFILVGCSSSIRSAGKHPASSEVPVSSAVNKHVELVPAPPAGGKDPQRGSAEAVSSSSPVHDQEKKKTQIPIGMIFAKTVFQGVVQTSYVQLTIVNDADPPTEFQLFVGDKARQQDFFWSVQTVKPGYFFITLPVGKYRITSIAIPVGTTKAIETMDITFEVREKKAVYLGTLEVTGTKEKVKLGGVPVIRPAFEYTVQVRDEKEEALNEFKKSFPDSKTEIIYDLFQVNRPTNREK